MKKLFHIEKIKKRRKTTWSVEEDRLLISLAQPQQRKSWKTISRFLLDKNAYQCYLRYRSINPNLRKGVWDPSEDKKILDAVQDHGKRWNLVAKIFSNRNSKQIRDRYINYLDPQIAQNKFTVDEDLLILELHNRYGNRWALIRALLPHRSSDMIKNRYKSSISRNKSLQQVLKKPSVENVSNEGYVNYECKLNYDNLFISYFHTDMCEGSNVLGQNDYFINSEDYYN
jgi:hypothetical protein